MNAISTVSVRNDNIFLSQTKLGASELKTSIAIIKSGLKNSPVSKSDIKNLSRVNEQELFAALTHRALSDRDPKLGNSFSEKFPSLVEELRSKFPKDYTFRAAKRIIRSLIKEGELSKLEGKALRRFAVGKSQLDSEPSKLSTSNITSSANDTAVRSFGKALEKIAKNEIASEEVMSSFRAHNQELKAEALAIKNSVELEIVKGINPETTNTVEEVFDKVEQEVSLVQKKAPRRFSSHVFKLS